jgi:hypothetical protein
LQKLLFDLMPWRNLLRFGDQTLMPKRWFGNRWFGNRWFGNRWFGNRWFGNRWFSGVVKKVAA